MISLISQTVAVLFGKKKQNPEVCVGAMKMTQNFHVEEIE